MGLLVAFFLISIFFSFLCSILEAVLLSITPAYVGLKEQENSPFAADLARYKVDIDRPLSAILTLNTVAHTVGAIGVGAGQFVPVEQQPLRVSGQKVGKAFGRCVGDPDAGTDRFVGLSCGFGYLRRSNA